MDGIDTLYDLCEATAVAIETQPGNYYQEGWETPARYLPHASGAAYREVCGTAFCRAGWMVNLAESPTTMPTGARGIPLKAKIMLQRAGISGIEIFKLFSGSACGSLKYGTAEYVKAGADGLREFMKTYEDKLKATKLADCLDKDGTLRTDFPICLTNS